MTFIPLGLAIYGFAYMMAATHGPFGLCKNFRDFVCGTCCKQKDGNCCRYEWIAEGVKCPICWGFWMCLTTIPTFGPFNAFSAWGLVTVFTVWKKAYTDRHEKGGQIKEVATAATITEHDERRQMDTDWSTTTTLF